MKRLPCSHGPDEGMENIRQRTNDGLTWPRNRWQGVQYSRGAAWMKGQMDGNGVFARHKGHGDMLEWEVD